MTRPMPEKRLIPAMPPLPKPRPRQRIAWAAGLLAMCCLGAAASAGELLQLPSRPGVTQGVWLDTPSAPPSGPSPAWVLILFAGDKGTVTLTDTGPRHYKNNFVIRTAPYWTAHGDATMIVDTPSDNPDGMSDPFRLGDAAAQDVAAIVAAARQRYPQAKIALLGTSRGTITVGNVLKRSPGLADAFVLTSPVTVPKGTQTGLAGLDWTGVHARVLVVSNEGDGCTVSPFANAKDLAAKNGFDFIPVSSDEHGVTGDCGPESPHGYLGIESQVLDAMNGWLEGKGP